MEDARVLVVVVVVDNGGCLRLLRVSFAAARMGAGAERTNHSFEG